MPFRAVYSATVLLACLVGFVLTLAVDGCIHAQPNLSPAAVVAFHNTRVIKALDIIRDTAQDGSRTAPPVVSVATARKITQWHRSALLIVHEAANGWQATVMTGLDELLRDLSPEDRQMFAPYVALAKALIQEIP